MQLTKEEINLIRQWFNAVQDLNDKYLKKADHKLYEKMLENINEEYLKGGFMKERKNFEQFAKECPWRCREECQVISGCRVCDFEDCGLWYIMKYKPIEDDICTCIRESIGYRTTLFGNFCNKCGKLRD